MEEKRARDSSSSSLSSDHESLCYYAPNWKRGAFSFPSGTVGSMGTAFTRAQWLELQRQAMIYKHITASVPVPPYLLVPFHYSNAPYCMIGGAGGMVNLGYLVNNTDPEPRRCRRTDGKKWRCSKDAAPDQKYCERHLHRGKPRSRKLVEGPKRKAPEPVTTTAPAVHCTNPVSVAPPIPMVKGNVDNSSWNYSYGLFGYEEDKSSSLLKHGNTRITEAISDNDTSNQWRHHGSHSFPSLNSDLSAISERTSSVLDARIERGGYIDAWSAEKAAATLNSTNNLASLDLQHCGLSLSMSNDRTDLGTNDDPFSAMPSPVTWSTNHESSLCGPLGEFFQPHQQLHIDATEEPRAPAMLIDESNEISPDQSPTRRFAWSPTGVLQKTFSSHSDNSNASSPGNFVGMGSGSAIYYHHHHQQQQQHVIPDFK